jgi:G3E family GTPase
VIKTASTPAPAVPVVLLAGFLGAGKTTLLNHLLKDSRGTRIGVVVNDFGAVEIDAMTVAGQVGSMVSLGNGCLCCAVDSSELDVYLERLTRQELGIDVVVIEASGLAEPRELVRMLLATDIPRAAYGGLVEVVDAANFAATRARHPELARHLAAADLVVLNKADLADEAERASVRAAVAEASPGTPVVEARGRIDPEVLFDRREWKERVGQLSFEDALHDESDDGGDIAEGGVRGSTADGARATGTPGREAAAGGHEGHLHDGYDTVSFVRGAPMDPRELMRFLDGRPEGLYRIKGYVDFGAADPANRYALHAVGRFLRFAPEAWPPGEQRGTRLVLIGAGLDGDALVDALDACRAAEGAGQDERAMWGVLRFVADPATGELGEETGAAADRDGPAGPDEGPAAVDPDTGVADPDTATGTGDPGPTAHG